MKTSTLRLLDLLVLGLLGSAFLGSLNAQTEKETRYLSFQIFTYGPDPKIPRMGEGTNPIAKFPDKATLRDYIEDIKRRVGTVGDKQTRLAVTLGPLSFDHTDAEAVRFIQLGFELALETDVAVGFHIDDSMFWTRRKDLWSDPQNVEALDWDGTPNTGRRLDWQTAPGGKPDITPPQMCFNSKAIVQLVQQRSALLGKAIQEGVKLLQERKRPELFAGVIAGWETMIGQDFKTGKYLGYRALLNQGFSREHPPQDMDLEREKVVQEFIELWAKGFADAGISTQKIYSHTAPFPQRAYKLGGKKETTYAEHNHFAITSVAFGKYHQPGFSTYPTPGRFEDIYEELDKHKQVGWSSSEGTNLQLGTGPGQSGMTMETYLGRIFNHGGTLANVYAWGIGGEAGKNMSFRQVTEGEESLQVYRKFLKGETLVDAKGDAVTLMERLPPKIHRIQEQLPGWIQNADNKNRAGEVTALMQKLQEQLKGKAFEDAEKTADSILKMMGAGGPAAMQPVPVQNADELQQRVTAKVERVYDGARRLQESGGDVTVIAHMMEEKVKPLLDTGRFVEAEAEIDRVLEYIEGGDAVHAQVPERARAEMRHRLDSSFVVFRDKVQEELKLTAGQIEKLEVVLPDVMEFLQNIKSLTPEEQDSELKAFRLKAHEKLAAVLMATLNDGQRARLRQIELQRDQLFGAEAWNDLGVTDEQRQQFMALIQQTQKKIGMLMKEIQAGASPDEVRPKVLQSRADLEGQMEALLTEVQRKQWKEMLGKPMAVDDLFDMTN